MYTKSEIKKHKGSLIRLTYNGRNRKEQTGKITAVTPDHILFRINVEYEKPIEISKISHIEQLKSFSHYIRITRRYLNERKHDKAISTLIEMKEIFKLPEQLAEIEDLNKRSIEMAWKLERPETNFY